MELEAIKALVKEAKDHLTAYNVLADKLAAEGVTIELDTMSRPHGVVGIGRVDSRQIHASFLMELD